MSPPSTIVPEAVTEAILITVPSDIGNEVVFRGPIDIKQKKASVYKRRRKKYRDAKMAKGMRKAGIKGMLATTHLMVAKKPTSEKVRCVLGEAMMEVSSRKGNMKKAYRRKKALQKNLTGAVKVSQDRAVQAVELFGYDTYVWLSCLWN